MMYEYKLVKNWEDANILLEKVLDLNAWTKIDLINKLLYFGFIMMRGLTKN